MTLDTAYTKIERLVKNFKALSAPARKAFNEDNTRKNFILPLFAALDWDIQSAEVSAEEKVSRGFVDFAFRINGVPRFFLETKRINEDLTKPDWVRQTVDYAWIKGVTWALLSDFEGLRVFNAEWKEYNPLQAQFIEFSVDTYLTDFERLWWLSRGETEQGRLDREAEKVGKKTKRLPVNQHLFDDLRAWRQELFNEFHGYNSKWSPAQIDQAVLKLLNRLIFIRTLEDRQVEPVQLKALVHEAKERGDYEWILKGLRALFHHFDEVYDSELFRAGLIDQLYATSQPLEKMINGLYGSSYFNYDFNAIDADVLGTVYEQYLGHIVTNPQAAEVVEKRTKRKSQGIFYTPTFVVKYIVQQTVGKYLAEQGYSETHPPRILDMACGSGSFLIEAFDTLDRFVADKRGQAHGKQHELHDHARRLEILSQCIFGVDKDQQAVEVARLNLLLKASFQPARLPLLQNIVHADSLRLDWDKEFKEVMEDGGFDIIIGNPPYVLGRETFDDSEKRYLASHYEASGGKYDLYIYFSERGMSLLRPHGRLGYILPNTILANENAARLREILLGKTRVEVIKTFSSKVFDTAQVESAILVVKNDPDNTDNIVRIESDKVSSIPQAMFLKDATFRFNINSNSDAEVLIEKISSVSTLLGDISEICIGIQLGGSSGSDTKDDFLSKTHRDKTYKKVLDGKNINRYQTIWEGIYVRYGSWLHRKRDEKYFLNPKLVIRQIGATPIATYDENRFYTLNTIYNLIGLGDYSLKYVLGVMNSKLGKWFWIQRNSDFKSLFPKIKKQQIESLPIRRINFDNKQDKRYHDRMVALVEEMLQLQKDYAATPPELDDKRFALQKRIARVDTEIDALVYQLYGLTDEEIRIMDA